MASKQDIFEKTLRSPYNADTFVDFIREMIVGVNILSPGKEQKPYSASFSFYVSKYFYVGKYEDNEGDTIGIFAIELNRGESVENARSAQRAFVKTLLEKSGYAGALVAFYSTTATGKQIDTWRFSFIRMDYEFAKGKIKETLTPAKRYSYLVGKGEPCHTAMDRLFPIFANDNAAPTLDVLEEAFSVETVTKEFFEQYREKYLEMKEFLEDNDDFVEEAETRGFTSEQFTKKLLAQIVFLYFVQKKGWLGVNAVPRKLIAPDFKRALHSCGAKSRALISSLYFTTDESVYHLDMKKFRALSPQKEEFFSTIVKGQPWGTGPKDFMRHIFNDCIKRGKNFFDDYLEPLFYTGLNQNRGEDAYFLPLHCRIPFLNGGLFEELDNYDWQNNDFAIPNEMFSNADEKGRDADGVLDIFDRYNFTMAEDEPMEREVAVDPEMLGKVFENLLEVKDRKSKGAFYTPREIVHYMCQESLINYLVTKSGIPEEDIRKLVLFGEYFKGADVEKTLPIDNKTGKVLHGKEIYRGGYHMELDKQKDFEIPETIFSYKKGVNRLAELDELLANVKVVDPAVGSGAFPLGLLNEIVKTRDTLSTYMAMEMTPRQKKDFYAPGMVGSRNVYDIKAETIKNCIFACDIEPSATDIAKLRLWLSLVIEDELSDSAFNNGAFGEHSKPKQLPNLDCNIICGNSLDDTFCGIDFIKESDVLKNITEEHQENMLQAGVDSMISTLIDLQDKLFYTKEAHEKTEIKEKIQGIYDAIIEEHIRIKPETLQKYRDCLHDSSRPFVLWQLYFPKVFRDNGGFDICIGNPPYIQLQSAISEDSTVKLGDLYKHLHFKTFAKTGDIYCLFYEKGISLLRENGVLTFITSNKWMRAGYGKLLRGYFAKETNPLVLIDFAGERVFESATVDVNILMTQNANNNNETLACIVNEAGLNNLSVFVKQNASCMSFDSDDSWTILSPIEQNIKNKIETKGIPLKEWDISINYGIKTGCNEAFIIDGETKNALIADDPKSAEIIRPILRGRDIKRYGYDFADLWLITTHNGVKNSLPRIDVEAYPAIKKHLDFYWDKISVRADKGDTPYNLRNCAYMDDFSKRKIAWARLSRISKTNFDDFPRFALLEKDIVTLDSLCFFTGDQLESLVCMLNSKYAAYYFFNTVAILDNGGMQMRQQYVENILLPNIEISLNESEAEIDEKIFSAFEFTEDEIDFIESFLMEKKKIISST